ncbi:hypothetical protein Ciccas_014304, partial [Cichlidogyrus casuarinus]
MDPCKPNPPASQWFALTPDRHDAECLFCNFKPAMGKGAYTKNRASVSQPEFCSLIPPVSPTASSSSKTSDASLDDDSDPLYEAQEDEI